MVLSFYYCICFILHLHENSCFMHLDTTPTRQASFLNLLFARYIVDLSTSSSTPPSVPHDKQYSFCMHFICFSCFAFFFIPFVSMVSCCHVFLVHCSPCSLYVSFCLSLVKFFGFLCPLTIVSKMRRNLRFECHSLRREQIQGENFMLKGRNFFI